MRLGLFLVTRAEIKYRGAGNQKSSGPDPRISTGNPRCLNPRCLTETGWSLQPPCVATGCSGSLLEQRSYRAKACFHVRRYEHQDIEDWQRGAVDSEHLNVNW
jgi:hypothetical protein